MLAAAKGFSDDMFDKAAAVNSDAQLYKQAGNGVTIPVVYAVGKRIVEIQNELNKEHMRKRNVHIQFWLDKKEAEAFSKRK